MNCATQVPRASIDIGSNSVLLLIASVLDGTGITELGDHSRVTALGKDLDVTKEFAKESMENTFKALLEYKQIIEENGLSSEETIVTATEASRVAKNAPEFFEKIKKELGFTIQTITSEGEAYYTGRGISLGDQSDQEQIIIDLGGASTELIKISSHPFEIKSSISIPVGSVRGNDWLEKNTLEEEVKERCAQFNLDHYASEKVTLVAGTATTLACMYLGLKKFDASKLNGQVITMENFEKYVSSIFQQTPEALQEQFPYIGKRARTVGSGGLILCRLMSELKVKTISISTFGLRHGTLYEGEINGRYRSSQR